MFDIVIIIGKFEILINLDFEEYVIKINVRIKRNNKLIEKN